MLTNFQYCNQGMTKAKLQLVNMFNLMDREKDGLLTR